MSPSPPIHAVVHKPRQLHATKEHGVIFTPPIHWDSPKKQILRLFITPILITCTLCITTFVLLHNIYAQSLTQANTQFLLSYFEHLAKQAPTTNDPHSPSNAFSQVGFQAHANIILQTGLFEGLSLLNEQKQRISHAGLPHKQHDYHWVTQLNQDNTHKNHTHSAIKIIRVDGAIFWLILTINNTPKTLLFAQTLLWGLILTLVIGFIAAGLALRSYRQLLSPINKLTGELKNAANGNFHQKLTPANSIWYAELINSAQQLLEINKGLKEGIQSYTDQATKELRESLETVEIQNIELDLARKNALKTSDNKSELLANTSHEIRTPLNGILGFTHLLLKTALNDQQKDYLATIEQSAQGLLTVINDIIDYSRLESDSMSFEYKPVNIRNIISELLQVYAPSANESHLKLVQLIDPQLPATLLGDPLRLKQVINNLIQCVIALAPSGNLIIESRVKQKNDSKWILRFTVKNPTTLISQQNKQQLHTALSQNSHLSIGDAPGIGLTIAQALTERMQGSIKIEDHEDILSFVFTVELGETESSPSMQQPFNGSAIKALICDNNPWSRQEITEQLTQWGIDSFTLNGNPANSNYSPHNDSYADIIAHNNINLAIIDCITDGRRFNIDTLAQHVTALLEIPNLHIGIIAPSHIRRQLEKHNDWSAVHFVTRPLVNNALIQLLQQVAGLPSEPAINTPTQALSILIADDNPANRKLVCAFLDKPNHTLITAENGRQAVDEYKAHSPDVIFMDVQMPNIDGLEATRMIRQLESTTKRTPIIALTANVMPEQRSRILVAGMDDYLTKPVSDEDLFNALKRWGQHSKSTTTATPKSIDNAPTPPLDTEPTIKPISTLAKTFSLKESLTLTKNNSALAKDMLLMLIEELPSTMDTIQTSLINEDITVLSEAVHKLRGGSAYTGLMDLRQKAIEADNALQAGNLGSREHGSIEQLSESINKVLEFTNTIDISTLFEDDD